MSLSKISIQTLKQVKAAILAEPELYDQRLREFQEGGFVGTQVPANGTPDADGAGITKVAPSVSWRLS